MPVERSFGELSLGLLKRASYGFLLEPVSLRFVPLNQTIYGYLQDLCQARSDPIVEELRAETLALGPVSNMAIPREEASLLSLLVSLMGAKLAIELGTFTGLSAIAIARSLPPGGKLFSCDIEPRWTQIAVRYWERLGLSERIELKLGPALETLRALPRAPLFDFAFVDADKENYELYYEELLPRLRPGGLIAFDNMLREGKVAESPSSDPATAVIHELNRKLAQDRRVEGVLLPVADGIYLARKVSTGLLPEGVSCFTRAWV
ncbi:O-methyltransferase [Candidatus Methylacidithermus pantelleriae]|uniref:O-methyltransferase n=1 Tax=Candidatus Methylacidithermus pantelleriae TaxID=2744239 RepID=A0A8J2FRK4_9BACT|nr:class I SAM-dependent methyltransferase [Candidatus Methylacidithermus pantelleriae]CAF0689223.1 O-methyltransferase [Candidatus Methylacidithermus pantelleriae]